MNELMSPMRISSPFAKRSHSTRRVASNQSLIAMESPVGTSFCLSWMMRSCPGAPAVPERIRVQILKADARAEHDGILATHDRAIDFVVAAPGPVSRPEVGADVACARAGSRRWTGISGVVGLIEEDVVAVAAMEDVLIRAASAEQRCAATARAIVADAAFENVATEAAIDHIDASAALEPVAPLRAVQHVVAVAAVQQVAVAEERRGIAPIRVAVAEQIAAAPASRRSLPSPPEIQSSR